MNFLQKNKPCSVKISRIENKNDRVSFVKETAQIEVQRHVRKRISEFFVFDQEKINLLSQAQLQKLENIFISILIQVF